MLRPVLNRYVWIGAVCSCIWSVILPVIPLRLGSVMVGVSEIQAHRALGPEENLGVILFAAGVAVISLAPLGIGWFAARGSISARAAAKLPIAAGNGAFGGALAVGIGMLPLTTLVVFWNFPRSILAGDASGVLGGLVALVFAVSLGAFGGALYFWMYGRRCASSQDVVQTQQVGGPNAPS